MNTEQQEKELEQEKQAWTKPEVNHLSAEDSKGGGFSTNEATTTKPGS